MTRKCVLCKETNYRRKYSFFSAPKDPEVRKKWQRAIGVRSYTVTDDTYVCSKHFHPNDIITHWVSGIPPHVVTIKYKKCRLRPGAVPDPDMEILNLPEASAESETDDSWFQIPRESLADSGTRGTNEEVFLIPRQKEREINHGEEIDTPAKIAKYDDPVEDEAYDAESGEAGVTEETNKTSDAQDPIEFEGFDQEMRKMETLDKHFEENLERYDANRQDHNESIQETTKSGRITTLFPNEDHQAEYETSVEMWEVENEQPEENTKRDDSLKREPNPINKKVYDERFLEVLIYQQDPGHPDVDHRETQSDTMLFEDLLEIYTEVTLPRGWSFLVTSKGHSTTVVYLYMNMPMNEMPVVEKEVFIKSDMIMRCGTASKEINPFVHDLVRGGKHVKVQALSDIEDLIEEFDQRSICEGSPSVVDVKVQVAHKEGVKWRHIACPLIINNGASKCSKCAALGTTFSQWVIGKASKSEAVREKQQKIRCLRRNLEKLTKRNQRLEEIRVKFRDRFRVLLQCSQEAFKTTIESSNMPEIQKLMVKECLKASMFDNKKNVRYSETWVFLCLLLYVESPRMYRYMLLNNYMTLPSMRTIRRYLHQVKTDPEFYNLFQQSVEPFQPIEEDEEEKEPT